MAGSIASMTPLHRLMQRVQTNDRGCWEYTGTLNNKGYGEIGLDYKKHLAHRLSWELHYGPIPPGMYICHMCDNPRCFNPLHLFLGTPSENQRDMFTKGRNGWSTRPRPDDMPCKRGHSPNWYRNNRGHRFCRTCQAGREKKYAIKMRGRKTKPQ